MEKSIFLYLPSVRYTFRRLLVPPFVCCSLTCEHPVNTPIASVQKSAYMLVNQEGEKTRDSLGTSVSLINIVK